MSAPTPEPDNEQLAEALALIPEADRVDYVAWVWSGRVWPPLDKAREDAAAYVARSRGVSS